MMKQEEKAPSKGRLFLGGAIFITGFLVPLLIPLVMKTNWSTTVKSVVSGILAIGLPEVFMLVAAAVLGKSGFQYLKSNLFGWFKKHGPPDLVSKTRYRIGLVLFMIPLLIGVVLPYLLIVEIELVQLYMRYFTISGDVLLLISLFVLGGGFWDKIRSLFIYQSKAIFNDEAK